MCNCLSETCRSVCKGSGNSEDHQGDQSKTVLLKRGRDTFVSYVFVPLLFKMPCLGARKKSKTADSNSKQNVNPTQLQQDLDRLESKASAANDLWHY
jgi:hypothetical protein